MIDIRTESKGYVAHGVSACAGCGMELIIRNVLDVLGQDTTLVIPPGCSARFCGFGCETGIKVSAFQGNLENSAAIATGIRAGSAVQGNDHTHVVAFAGDGATLDIGLQSLSGMMERGEDVLYICYDNEAYMNTGIQKSSLTPFGAKTTTTPAGSNMRGCLTQKKNMFEIVAAHGIPYAATASIGYLNDFMRKVEHAATIRGTKYIHVMAPCPTGWGCDVDETVDISKDIVDCGLWYLAEYEGGAFKLNRNPREFASVEAYLRRQGRFKALTDEDIAQVEAARDAKWEVMRRDWA